MGLTSLVKPHALFLATAFALFFLVSSGWRVMAPRIRMANASTFLTTTLVVKLLGGLLLAGPSGLTLFGGYGTVTRLLGRFLGLITQAPAAGNVAELEEASAEATMSLVELTVQQFGLHTLAVGFLLAPALYVFFASRFRVSSSIAELALITLGVMMVVISIFGAYVTAGGDDHTDRILLRYYEFLIPVVYLGSFEVLRQHHPKGPIKFIVFGVLLTSFIVIAANGMEAIDLKIADSSYLLGIFGNLDQLWLFSAAVIIAFLFILGGPEKLAQYTAVTVSIATILTGYSVQQNQLDINSTPIGSDIAGQYVRDYLPDVPGDEILVVGSSKTLVEASIFWMDRAGVDYQLYEAGSLLPLSEIPEGKSVVVQILDVSLKDRGSVIGSGEGWSVVRYAND